MSRIFLSGEGAQTPGLWKEAMEGNPFSMFYTLVKETYTQSDSVLCLERETASKLLSLKRLFSKFVGQSSLFLARLCFKILCKCFNLKEDRVLFCLYWISREACAVRRRVTQYFQVIVFWIIEYLKYVRAHSSVIVIWGTSLVGCWLRVHLAMQGRWVWSQVRELRSHMQRSNEAQVSQLKSPCTAMKDPARCNQGPTQPNK